MGLNDTILCADSKRKMQSVLGYKRDERVFGGEAVNAVCSGCSRALLVEDGTSSLPGVVYRPQDSLSPTFLTSSP